MAIRRLVYLAVLEGCLVFYIAYREWLSWLALVAVFLLPLFSLLLSLPAMLCSRPDISCPRTAAMGTSICPVLHTRGKLPAPPVRCRLKVRHSLSDQQQLCKPGSPLWPEHCGVLTIRPKTLWVYDYMGLWRLPVRKKETFTVTILPAPVPMQTIPGLEQHLACAWKPKPGGLGENHELRLYRPGDDLRQIHWKLSSKTGKLIYRETMEPCRGKMLLTLSLSGSADQIDRKLGRLLWLSTRLLEQQLSHEIHCLTENGTLICPVADTESRDAAICRILHAPVTKQDIPADRSAAWQYHIGGEPDA